MKLAVCAALLGLGVLGCSSDSEPAVSTGSGGATGTGIEPIIPEPNDVCPEFITGPQDILGLNTSIVAGPPGASKGPLLITWHGTGGNGEGALRQLPQSVKDEFVAQGGVVIAPSNNGQTREGRDVTVGLRVWYDESEVRFADLVVGCAVKNHNVDPRRIYVTGCSAGGLMAGMAAAMRSSYIAAAAPNSGGTVLPAEIQDPERVPALMSMHGGTADNVIVNFGDTSRRLQELFLPAGSPMVVECNHNLGHCRAPMELHESAWEFMKAHPFGTKPSPYEGGLPAGFPAYCEVKTL
jgi:dienelactone hydrolase